MTVTITKAENGYIAQNDGKIYIGRTPVDAAKEILQTLSNDIEEEFEENPVMNDSVCNEIQIILKTSF